MLRKVILTTAAACAGICSQAQDLKIVTGVPDTTYSSVIYLRGVATPNSKVTVQGESYPVYSSGEWAAKLTLKEGDNPFELAEEGTGRKVTGSVFMKLRQAPAPITDAVAEDVEILPSRNMSVAPGDEVKIRLRSVSGAQVTWLGGHKLYELPVSETGGRPGIFQGHYYVAENDTVFNSPVTLEIKTPDTTAVQQVKAEISVLDPQNPMIVRTKEDAYLNYGLGGDRLGGAKINYLSAGIKMQVDGKVGNMYKVRLSKNTDAWIPSECVEVMPEGTFAPSSLTGSWSVRGDGKYDYVTVGLSERLPYIVTEDVEASRIIVDIYGAACNTNWITQLKSYKEVKNVGYKQVQDDVFRLEIDLRHKQMWGYSVYYQGTGLVVKVKHRPESLRLKNLTIAIDAGHGEPWNGARTTSGVKEQDLTKDMAEHLRKVLESKGAKVVMTRPGVENTSMTDRKRAASEAEADLFVSIHCNAGGSPFAAKGTSTYYRHLSHKQLSVDVLDCILEMDVKNFGNIGNFNFSLNQPTEYPSVLVETLFLSSPEDSDKILKKEFRDEMMERVAWGIEKFLAGVDGSDAKAPKKFKPSRL